MPVIRTAVADDVPAILGLIRDLAAYEGMPDAARATEDQLHAALFGPHPAAFCHVAEYDFLPCCGVRRRRGLGVALLRTLAETAVANGYARVEWSVLDWNKPSIDFYEGLGARPQSGWTVYRLAGEALTALGCRTTTASSATATATPAPMRFTP